MPLSGPPRARSYSCRSEALPPLERGGRDLREIGLPRRSALDEVESDSRRYLQGWVDWTGVWCDPLRGSCVMGWEEREAVERACSTEFGARDGSRCSVI